MVRNAIVSMTMVLVAVSHMAALLLPAVGAAAPAVVGIRVVFAEPPEGEATCTKEEHNTIVELMHDGIVSLMDQQLDSARQLWFDDDRTSTTDPRWCRNACRAMAPGTCYIAYPPCDDTRRLTREVRLVTDPDEFVRLCHEEQDAVLASIKDGVEEVSESCNKLLQTDFEVTCSDLSEESPVFVAASSASAAAAAGGFLVLATLVVGLITAP